MGGSFDHINLSYFYDFPPHATLEEEKLHTTMISLRCANSIRSSSKSFIAMSLASTAADHFTFLKAGASPNDPPPPFSFSFPSPHQLHR